MLLSAVFALVQTAVAPVDDGSALRAARRAQARFETVRRAHLPWNRSAGSARCDAQIGRFCYWYDSTQTTPAPEPARIIDARNELLLVLDAASLADADDAWISGQRVRYLLEAGRTSDAVAVARACRAERWHCAALEGLALHVSEQYADADSVFTTSLDAMPAAQRCDWMDVRRLVEGPLERELSRADCREREALSNRLFDLSGPLWSVPGNDLRTEHLARLTMAEILAKSANAHAMAWSGDNRELMLRYGWSEWYTRVADDLAGLLTTPRIHGHDREPSYRFFPEVSSVRDVPRLTSESWRFRDPLARSRYAPRYMKGLTDLPHQLARFPRGDSMLVAVAHGVAHPALNRDTLESWLMVKPLTPGAKPATAARAGRGALLATLAREPVIVSVEVRGTTSERAARARYSLEPLPCDRWCLSDLLLYTPNGDSTSTDLQTMLATAATELTFQQRSPLGVLWEIQTGRDEPTAVWLSLMVSPTRVSRVRRLATRLRLAPDLAPVHVRWQAVVSASRETQHVTLRLPPSARGRYRVVLTVDAPGRPSMSSAREIEVLP